MIDRILPIHFPTPKPAPVQASPPAAPAHGNPGVVPPWLTGSAPRAIPGPTVFDPTQPVVTDPDMPRIMALAALSARQ